MKNKFDKVWWITEIIGDVAILFSLVIMATPMFYQSYLNLIDQKILMVSGYLFCSYGLISAIRDLITYVRRKLREYK